MFRINKDGNFIPATFSSPAAQKLCNLKQEVLYYISVRWLGPLHTVV